MPHHSLTETGAFVTVHARENTNRRGAVLRADGCGLTLRVTEGAKGRHDEAKATTEFWPWTSVVYLAEAEPRKDERELLKFV